MSCPWFYYVCRALIRTVFKLTRCEIEGIKHIPPQGPVLVVANHLSLADPPLLGVMLGRKMVFMAKKELFRFRVMGGFMGGLGAFPVHRGRLDIKALRRSLKLLEEGEALVVFPEGMRSRNEELQRAFSGIALIALKSCVPIVPVGIAGTEGLKRFWQLKRPQIKVNIGEPFTMPSVDGKLNKAELVELTNLIMRRVAELLPVEYRGYYGRRES